MIQGKGSTECWQSVNTHPKDKGAQTTRKGGLKDNRYRVLMSLRPLFFWRNETRKDFEYGR